MSPNSEVFVLTQIKSGRTFSASYEYQETFGIIYESTFTQEQTDFLRMLNDKTKTRSDDGKLFIDMSSIPGLEPGDSGPGDSGLEPGEVTLHDMKVLNSFTIVKMRDLSLPVLVTGYGTVEIYKH